MQTAQKLKDQKSGTPKPDLRVVKPIPASEKLAWFAVIVAGLGYFVDVFDMWLFSNFRVASLTSLGLTAAETTAVGATLFNCQMGGLIFGGFFWGILGDKKGRAKVMFGSIFIYSVANILNAFVTTVPQYQALRFLAGVGLAGEIGSGITLIVELLPKAKRGFGTTLVTCLGVSGAIFAALAGKFLDWRPAFILGGLMGLTLLFLRFMVHESGVFSQMKQQDENIKCGSLKLLFGKPERVIRFLSCIVAGIPLYLTFGLFATFAPEIAKGIGIVEPLTVSDVLLWASIGITAGDLLAGLLSQKLKSRKAPIFMMVLVGCFLSFSLVFGIPKTALQYQVLLGLLGASTGFWACLITAASENFGTNLRATVTTSVPNLIRGSAIFLTSAFIYLKGSNSVADSLLWITIVTYIVAFLGIWKLKETFHSDLDFYEK